MSPLTFKRNRTDHRHARKNRKSHHPNRCCNLCGGKFRTVSQYDRICPLCKDQSELYHFAEWLPETHEVV